MTPLDGNVGAKKDLFSFHMKCNFENIHADIYSKIVSFILNN